jgi:multimeric flavodoxin WrbA
MPAASPHVLIALGSPRRNGNSATLAAQVAAGAEAAGAEVESIRLHGMSIQPCTACDACRNDSADDCVLDDDMRQLYPKLRRADALVVASPVYWFHVSAQTKLFMDRWYALGGPQGYVDLEGKRVGIVLAYADPDPFVSGAANALRTFQDACRYVGADLVGMVYGSADKAGDIAANEALLAQARKLGETLAGGPP